METIDCSIAWNTDTVYALGLYRIITKVLGLWPSKSRNILSKIQVFIVSLLQMTMMLSMIAEINTDCSTINDILEVISLITCAIISIIKLNVLYGFSSKLLEVFNSAVEDWSRANSPKARTTMKKYAKLGRTVFLFQMGSAYATTVPMIIGPLPIFAPQVHTNGTNANESVPLRGLPLHTSCIIGDASDIFYAVVFAVQALQLLSTCAANVGIDVYFFGVTMHLCGQFRLLCDDFENFDTGANEEAQRDSLIGLIRRHVELSRMAQCLEDSFNIVILTQLTANSMQMCLMGVQMLLNLKANNTAMIVNTVIILYVMSLQLFLYSYAGDRLSSEIANIRVSAYFSPWYEMTSGLARDVLFVIMRNHKNFNITAGKVYRIDIDNFKNLIKGLGSYFSVLRIMFDA